MGKQKDLTGMRFGRLVALEVDMEKKAISPRVNHWICQCDCGKKVTVETRSLMSGHTKSCRCIHKTHGLAGTRIYRIWIHMLRRCENPKDTAYYRYGGRGIIVCGRWHKFENFAEDMGIPLKEETIERKDNDGGYHKDNCRWATMKEQSSNTSKNRWIVFCGEKKTLTQWSELTGINVFTLMSRLKTGWALERAFTTPPLNKNQYTNVAFPHLQKAIRGLE